MLIYLDICCLNRPFDDQSSLVVRLQTEAKLFVQEKILSGEISLAWSTILDLENSANPYLERRNAVSRWRQYAQVDIVPGETVVQLAKPLEVKGIKSMDALHLACAIEANAQFLLTTDKILLRKASDENRVQVLDPVDFVRFIVGQLQ
jgi:predicted nucleic acid-binding protein